jgi:ribosomal 50S subunit-associated protein YjgA (DUF615 family)
MLEAEVDAVKKAQGEQTEARRQRTQLLTRLEEANDRLVAADSAVQAATQALLAASGLRFTRDVASEIVEGGSR